MKQLLLLPLFLITTQSFAAKIDITMTGITGGPAKVFYAVINDPKQFPDGKTVKNGTIEVDGKQKEVKITLDLPPGSYAISTFLDENNNGKMDKRLGIPTERFEFSNNPKLKFGPPSFSECEVRVQDRSRNATSIKLKYFRSHIGV